MQNIPYALGNLIYAQIFTLLDLAFIVGVLSRYSSKPGMDHWIAIKRVMRYLQGSKDDMLIYQKLKKLELIGYSDFDLACCLDTRKSTYGYILILVGGAIS